MDNMCGDIIIVCDKPDARRTCDRCGRHVPERNDVTVLLYLMYKDTHDAAWVYLNAWSRHLLPVVENGQVVCPGSPSRTQYLEGQPRDTRSEVVYDHRLVSLIRTAYAKLQRVSMVQSVANR